MIGDVYSVIASVIIIVVAAAGATVAAIRNKSRVIESEKASVNGCD